MVRARRALQAAAGVATMAAGWYVMQRRKLGSGFKATRVPRNRVAAYTLSAIERDEGVMCGGVRSFSAVDTGEKNDMSFDELMKKQNIVLFTYDLDQQILVFMEVDDKEALWREPFLDRGVRKLASGPVYVCSIDTAADYCQQHKEELPDSKRDTFLFVWNTGRCGSTLLARLTSAVGCSVTLSEPDWVDQLGHDRARLCQDPREYQKLVWLLHTLDFQLARTLLPSGMTGNVIYSLNPKGIAGFLREPVVEVFPNAKHVFMYRDLLKVVESFGSIFGAKGKLWMAKMMIDNLVGGPGKRPAQKGPPSDRFGSAMMKECFSKLKPPSGFFPKMLGMMWMDAVGHWIEFKDKHVPSSATLTLRMDEFVTKDESKRESVVKDVLTFSSIPTNADVLAKALAVFGVHSQAGTAMAKSSAQTGKTFLTDKDRQELTEMCVDAPLIGKPGVIIPGSLGTKSSL